VSSRPRQRIPGERWDGDLAHIGDFVRTCCRKSPHGESLDRLYASYLTTTGDPAPFALFKWWLRGRHDTVWIGAKSGGEWIVGMRLREPHWRSEVA
jgi:hypothetical protein